MKPLMAAILLRMPGIDPIELDAEFQPPYRQMRELPRPGRRKGRAVVGAQRPRQPILPERALKPRPHAALARCDDPATEYEPTAGINHRQRIAPRGVRG